MPPLRFAYQNRIGSALPIIAVETKLFEKHGLNIQPSRFNSGPACAESLYTGAANIGAMGDATCIIALSRKAPLRIITSHATGEERHRLIVSSDAPFKSIEDLRGKRIGIKKGTSTYGGFLTFLASHTMSENDVNVVNLKPHTMPDALAAGSIDAFAASEPTPSLGEMRGGRELATFGGLGNNFPIMMLATERCIRERRTELDTFMAALHEAERIVHNDQATARSIVAKATGLPLDITQKAMDRHRYRLCLDTATLASLRETAAFLRGEGIIKDVPELRVMK